MVRIHPASTLKNGKNGEKRQYEQLKDNGVETKIENNVTALTAQTQSILKKKTLNQKKSILKEKFTNVRGPPRYFDVVTIAVHFLQISSCIFLINYRLLWSNWRYMGWYILLSFSMNVSVMLENKIHSFNIYKLVVSAFTAIGVYSLYYRAWREPVRWKLWHTTFLSVTLKKVAYSCAKYSIFVAAVLIIFVHVLDDVLTEKVIIKCLFATFGPACVLFIFWSISVWLSISIFHREKMKKQVDAFFLNMRYIFEEIAIIIAISLYLPWLLMLGFTMRYYIETNGDGFLFLAVLFGLIFTAGAFYLPWVTINIVNSIREYRLATMNLPPRDGDIGSVKDIYVKKSCFAVEEHVMEQLFLLQQLSDSSFQHHHLSRNDGHERLVRLEREIYACTEEAETKWKISEMLFLDKFGGPLDSIYVGYRRNRWWWFIVSEVIEKLVFVVIVAFVAPMPGDFTDPKAWENVNDSKCSPIKLLDNYEGISVLMCILFTAFMFILVIFVHPHNDRKHYFADVGCRGANLVMAFLGLALSQCWLQDIFENEAEIVTGLIFIGGMAPILIVGFLNIKDGIKTAGKLMAVMGAVRFKQWRRRNRKIEIEIYTSAAAGDVVHLKASLHRWIPNIGGSCNCLKRITSVVSTKHLDLSYVDKRGRNALMIAAEGATKEHCKCIRILIERFPEAINIQTTEEHGGFTALHCAYLFGGNMSIRTLIKAGADQNIKSAQGLVAKEMISSDNLKLNYGWNACLEAAKRGANGQCNDLQWATKMLHEPRVNTTWWWDKAVIELGIEQHQWTAAAAFGQVQGLKHLDFSGLKLKNESDILDPEFEILLNNSGAESVSFANCNLRHRKIVHLAKKLKTNDDRFIKDVDFSGNQLLKGGIQKIFECLPKTELLNFSNCEIRFDGCQEIASHIQEQKSLQTLLLADCKLALCDSGLTSIIDAVRLNQSLTRLNLSGNLIPSTAGPAIANLLRSNENIVDLNLSSNQLKDDGCVAIASALEQQKYLKSINLSGNMLSVQSGKAIAGALETNECLTSLIIRDNHLGDKSAKAFARTMTKNSSLLELDLAGCALGLSVNEATIGSNHDAKSNIEGMKNLLQAISENNTLTSLDLENNALAVGIVVSLTTMIEKNYSITHLNLSEHPEWYSSSDGESGRALGKSFTTNTSLKSFVSPDLGGADESNFLNQIASCKSLTKLDLSHVKFNEMTGNSFAEGIREKRSLVHLDLSNCFSNISSSSVHNVNSTEINREPILQVLKFLKSHSDLKYLCLQGNELGKLSNLSLAMRPLLESLSNLKHVNFAHNNLNDDTGVCISEALATTSSNIVHVTLSNNDIGDTTGYSLLKMIEMKSSIIEIEVKNTRISVTVLEELANMCEHNLWRKNDLQHVKSENKEEELDRSDTELQRDNLRWKFYFTEVNSTRKGDSPLKSYVVQESKNLLDPAVEDKAIFVAAALGDRHALENALKRIKIIEKLKPWVAHRPQYRSSSHGMKTAVMIAAAHDHQICLRLLINNRYMVDTHSSPLNGGITALHCAYAHGCRIPVNMLIESGANVHCTDLNGYTPAEYLSSLPLRVSKGYRAFLFAGQRGSISDVEWLLNYCRPTDKWWVPRVVQKYGCQNKSWLCAGTLGEVLKISSLNFVKGPGLMATCMKQSGFRQLLNKSGTQKINFADCSLGYLEIEALCEILMDNTTITNISFRGNRFYTRGCKALTNMMQFKHSRHIDLDLSDCGLDRSCVEILGTGLENNLILHALNLSENPNIGEDISVAPFLCRILLCNQLQVVDLSQCGINDDMFEAILSSLATSSSSVKTLRFAKNKLSYVAGIRIGKIIRLNQNLETVDFSSNNIDSRSISDIISEVNKVKTSSINLTVYLGNNKLSSEDFSTLEKVFSKLDWIVIDDEAPLSVKHQNQIDNQDLSLCDISDFSSSDDDATLSLDNTQISTRHFRQRDIVKKHKEISKARQTHRMKGALKYLRMTHQVSSNVGMSAIQSKKDPRDDYNGPKSFVGIEANCINTRDGHRGMGHIKFAMPKLSKNLNISDIFRETEEGLVK